MESYIHRQIDTYLEQSIAFSRTDHHPQEIMIGHPGILFSQGWMDGWMNRWMDEWMGARTDLIANNYVYISVDEWMDR